MHRPFLALRRAHMKKESAKKEAHREEAHAAHPDSCECEECSGECCSGCCDEAWPSCGMHWCKKCAPIMVFFGILFLAVGTKIVALPEWFNMEFLLGLILALSGIMATIKK